MLESRPFNIFWFYWYFKKRLSPSIFRRMSLVELTNCSISSFARFTTFVMFPLIDVSFSYNKWNSLVRSYFSLWCVWLVHLVSCCVYNHKVIVNMSSKLHFTDEILIPSSIITWKRKMQCKTFNQMLIPRGGYVSK